MSRPRVHEAFELSRASYLVLPRLALQCMPDEWQERFVEMVFEVHEQFDFEFPGGYRVQAIRDGRFAVDPWADYRHGVAVERPSRTPEGPQ